MARRKVRAVCIPKLMAERYKLRVVDCKHSQGKLAYICPLPAVNAIQGVMR